MFTHNNKYSINSLSVRTNNVQTTNCTAVNIQTSNIQNLKKLAINKSMPQYTLDVNGSINFTGELLQNGEIYGGGGGGGDSYWRKIGNNIFNLNSGSVNIKSGSSLNLLSNTKIILNENSDFVIGNKTKDRYTISSEEFATLRAIRTNTTIQNQLNYNEAINTTQSLRTSQIRYDKLGSVIYTSILNNFILPNYKKGVLKCAGPSAVPQGGIGSSLIINEDITDLTISNSKLAKSTISGVPLGNPLFGLIFGNGLSGSINNNYNGSSSQILSVSGITPSMIKTGFSTGTNKFVLQNGDLGLTCRATTIAGSIPISGTPTLNLQGSSSLTSSRGSIINIGTSGTPTINIGNSYSTTYFNGELIKTTETILQVENKTITLNYVESPDLPGPVDGSGIIIDYNTGNDTLGQASILLNGLSGAFEFITPTLSYYQTNAIAVDTIVPTSYNSNGIINLGNPDGSSTISFPNIESPPFTVNSTEKVTNLCVDYLFDTTGTLDNCFNLPAYSKFVIDTVTQTASEIQDTFTFIAGDGITLISVEGSNTMEIINQNPLIYTGGKNIEINTTESNNIISTTDYLQLGDKDFNIVIDSVSHQAIDGTCNTILGQNVFEKISLCAYNIGIGSNVGNALTSGSNNILIGSNSDVTNPAQNNSVAIGTNALIKSDNQIVLGGKDTTSGITHSVYCPGVLTVGNDVKGICSMTDGNLSCVNINVENFIGTSDLSVTNGTFTGDLSVTKTTTLGSTTISGLTVTNNESIGGDLSVTGTTTLGTTTFTNYPTYTSTSTDPPTDDNLVTKKYVDENSGTVLLTSANTWSGTNTFTNTLTVGTITAGTTTISNGTITATGTISSTAGFLVSSDYRIKEDIYELDESYSIDNLKPIKFKNKTSNKEDIGLIAHELQEVYPFLVTGEKDGEDIQTVNYLGLIGILIHEIKNLKKEINQLKK